MSKPAVLTPAGATPPPRFRHTLWWYLSRFLILLQVVLFCGVIVALAVGKGLYDELQATVPDLRVLLEKNRAEPSRVYANDGSLLAEFDTEKRIFVPIDDLKVRRSRVGQMVLEPGRLIDATLAIEDKRFYDHIGADPKRIAGALLANYRAGRVEEGASTVTEQLVKNVYQNNSRTFSRRLNTALISLQLERRLSKDEILEAYLNEIYYGNRAYGCEAAAQMYFGKSAADLTIAEAAMLAGIPQNPNNLEPFRNFEAAKKRQRIVLREMWNKSEKPYARINWEQYQEALKDESIDKTIARQKQKLKDERANPTKWKSPYFVSYVRAFLQKNYGYDLDKPGLKVYTTIDPKLQQIADKAVKSGASQHGRNLQGALVSIDPRSGQVVAMVGGRDYYDKKMDGQFNRAVQGKRQPGSTMKPYIYAAAMEAGMTPNSTVVDSTLWVCGTGECPPGKRSKKRGGHEIKNYEGQGVHRGAISLQQALGQSNNVVATRLLLKVGIQNAIQKAHLMGVQSSLNPYPSLALGASEISLLEHVSAYGVFATKGLRAEATPIMRVENYTGDVLVQTPTQGQAPRVLSQNAANKMYQMLRYVVTNGTGRGVGNALPGIEIIGKTGTTSDGKDVWFMGASPQLVTGVWLGYDTPKPLGRGAAGGRWCGPIFADFMREAVPLWKAKRPFEKLVEDKRATERQRYQAAQYKQYVTVRVCRETGLLATKECPDTERRTFSAAGGAPTLFCDVHRRQPTQPRTLDNGAAPSRPGDLGFDPARDGNNNSNDDNADAPIDLGFPPARDENPMASAPRGGGAAQPQAPAYEGDSGVVLDGGNPQSLDNFDNQPVRRGNR